ncbi:hypothetical protein [Enterovibrio norvegicus]|uniref:hypothetical protein n=1 Tax=Enterovibrio TaxID=188143 RepID=UPI0002E22EFE|nr:hypothetical protein [Enterovibrio norvegicus]
MTKTCSKAPSENQTQFKPKIENFKTSLAYEGLSLNKTNKNRSIEELKQAYAR